MLFLYVAQKVEFYGLDQCIISKFLEYNVFLFSYKVLYSFMRLQLAFTLLRTWAQGPIVRLPLALAKENFFEGLSKLF